MRSVSFGSSQSVGYLLKRAENYLVRHGVPEPKANAEFMMARALGIGRGHLEVERDSTVSSGRGRRFWRWVVQRGRRIPLAYVLGDQDFRGLKLRVRRGVLIPRPETEELVELALALVASSTISNAKKPLRILDIGTGSGCISLSLARELPEAKVWGTDVSSDALRVARANARLVGLHARVRFIPAHRLPANLKADLVVSNPPYVPSSRLKALDAEVLKEPRLALDGGPDGLKAIREIISQAKGHLVPGGWLAMEIDHGQGPRVLTLLERTGFGSTEVRRDFQGLERFAIACLGPDRF